LLFLLLETAAALVTAAKATLAVIGGTLGLAGVAVLAEKIEEQTKNESKDQPEDEICKKCEKRRETKKERKKREEEEKRERDRHRPASDRYARHKKKELEREAGGGEKGKDAGRRAHDKKWPGEPENSSTKATHCRGRREPDRAIKMVSERAILLVDNNERLVDAVNNGRIEEVKSLLDGGASVETTDADGDSLLLLAAGEGDLELVKLLLERGTDPLRVGGDGFIVWHWVAYGCCLEIARLLLPLNKHIDMKDYDGMTPLWYALIDDCLEIAEFLLINGADPNACDDNGRNLLHDTAIRGDQQGVYLLLQYGPRIDIEDKHGALPCQYVPDDKPDLFMELVSEDW